MHHQPAKSITSAFACLIALTLAAITGCDSVGGNSLPGHGTASDTSLIRPAGEPGVGQQQFDTDDQAAAALVAAATARDHDAIDRIFGPSVSQFVTGDKVQDEKSFERFAKNASEHLELERKSANSSFIDIGNDRWPFPIPLTRLSSGKWFFDTEAGKQEILSRKIGANELETIKVCRAYVEAQREFASEERDDSGVLKYAQRFMSRSGKDGLYWAAAPGEIESPFGSLVAQATLEGYTPGKSESSGPKPFHGYYYRILTRQGPASPGGQHDYVINGNMIAGFALIASPSEHGASGVMTFIISHQGKLYQQDLGAKTSQIVSGMNEYNPDSGWTVVSP